MHIKILKYSDATSHVPLAVHWRTLTWCKLIKMKEPEAAAPSKPWTAKALAPSFCAAHKIARPVAMPSGVMHA